VHHKHRWFDPDRRTRLHPFERGDLKYVILSLLEEKPRHGYEVIRALEERFGGLYAPSPGSVYPTLQMLEDLGWVTASQQDGKRVYQITDEGKAFLAERGEIVHGIRERIRNWWNPRTRDELRRLFREVREMGQDIARAGGGRWRDPEKLERVREVVSRARHEIADILSNPEEGADE
jgi:DNA-binding PadR family transcriptional regulator